MDLEYGKAYRDLYLRHWWWRAREKAVLSLIASRLPAGNSASILDIGCGDGLFFSELSRFGRVEGLESSADIVNAQSPFRDRIHVGPFDASFQPGKQYDLILMLDVLEHLDDAVCAIRQGLSLLKKDGLFLFTVPAFMSLWTNHDVLNHHRIRFTKRSFRAVADAAGLQIEKEQYWYQWTVLPKLIQHIVESIFTSKPAVPKIPPQPVNWLLYSLSRIEAVLCWPWAPVGSSLMILGSKVSQNGPGR